jgi:hypothetical protein
MSVVEAKRRSITVLLVWLFGPIVWTAHFFMMYGTAAALCMGLARDSAAGQSRLIAVVLTVLAIALLLCFAAWQLVGYRRNLSDGPVDAALLFMRTTAIALAILALIGVVWVAVPAMVLSPCGDVG